LLLKDIILSNQQSTNPIRLSVAVWSDIRTRTCIGLSMGRRAPSRHIGAPVAKLLPVYPGQT